MFTRCLCSFVHASSLTRMYLTLAALVLVACAHGSLRAQTVSPCNPEQGTNDFKPTASITCQVPESGEFSYHDVVIPARVYIFFRPNSRNTPVTIKATGSVTISGRIYVNGTDANNRLGGDGGPGGFKGGRGGLFSDTPAGTAGDGPGGGAGGTASASAVNSGGGGSFATSGGMGADGGPNPGMAGQRYGTNTLLPLIGGSGGGGGSAGDQGVGGGGGGGGGAILISSATTFRFVRDPNVDNEYGIYAGGGGGGRRSGPAAAGGSGGSGGAIRLVASQAISGDPILSVAGGARTEIFGNSGGIGYIRVESLNLTQFNPDGRGSTNISLGMPGPATLANTPQLKIKSVGGQNAPVNPAGSFYQQPDIIVPTSVPNTATNPIIVSIEGTNIPAQTSSVQVTMTKLSGERETKPCTLDNQSPRKCSVGFVLPATTGETAVFTASATLDVLIALGRPLYFDGERVNKVEIAATFGSTSEVTYITESGRRIKLSE